MLTDSESPVAFDDLPRVDDRQPDDLLAARREAHHVSVGALAWLGGSG